MKSELFAKQFHCSILALALLNLYPTSALAQDSHAHVLTSQQHQLATWQQSKASALIKIVRESTERFKDVSLAEREGYALQFGCVSGPDSGAMGLHYVNGALVGSGVIDATRPQIVIYEPTPNGGLKLIGADYLVLADMWNAQHPEGPPSSWVSSFIFLRAPTALGCRRSTLCMSGPGRIIQWRFRELAPQRFLRLVHRPKPLTPNDNLFVLYKRARRLFPS
jgi:hypothetical protein